jgi:signal transduction histidine kinase
MPKLSVVFLKSALETSVEYIERRLPREAGKVDLILEVDGELMVSLNKELFSWVIENILKNALDAMENQGGRILVSAREVDSNVWIEIADTGKGIDRRQWKNVFRPGYSTKKRGWGLGLSLAKRIVEDYHGGTLTLAKSRPGEGTTFRIALPQRPSNSGAG